MIRLFGAALLVAGCGGFGFSLAAGRKKEAAMLRRLIGARREKEWELKYRMTEIPELCTLAGTAAGGVVKQCFLTLADRLEKKEVTCISGTMNAILNGCTMPRSVRRNMKLLGETLGRYDLEGQIQGLETVRRQCRKDLKDLEEHSVRNLRDYQTLAVCAGAALAILLF